MTITVTIIEFYSFDLKLFTQRRLQFLYKIYLNEMYFNRSAKHKSTFCRCTTCIDKIQFIFGRWSI